MQQTNKTIKIKTTSKSCFAEARLCRSKASSLKVLQKGFTMIELMIIMIIITILSGVFIPHLFNFEEKRANLVASDMWSIVEAVQSYDSQEGGFPDSSNQCVGAIDELKSASATFLQGIDNNTTPWGLGTRYSTNCSTSTSATTMTLVFGGDIPQSWAEYIVNQLPQATMTLTDPSTITVNITKLAYVPVLKKFLYLDTDKTTPTMNGSTQTISASGTYDGKKGLLTNVLDVYMTNRERPEETLFHAVFNQGLKDAWRNPTATVQKPNCDIDGDGVDDASPTVVVMPSSIAASNGEEIIAWNSNVTNTAGSSKTWDVWISLITPSSAASPNSPADLKEITPTSSSSLFFSTKCQPK
jgi:prepilin-type N-terminal cleavage/methylation domain-containing protein